jgi:hypothetical protein
MDDAVRQLWSDEADKAEAARGTGSDGDVAGATGNARSTGRRVMRLTLCRLLLAACTVTLHVCTIRR